MSIAPSAAMAQKQQPWRRHARLRTSLGEEHHDETNLQGKGHVLAPIFHPGDCGDEGEDEGDGCSRGSARGSEE